MYACVCGGGGEEDSPSNSQIRNYLYRSLDHKDNLKNGDNKTREINNRAQVRETNSRTAYTRRCIHAYISQINGRDPDMRPPLHGSLRLGSRNQLHSESIVPSVASDHTYNLNSKE